MRMYLYASKPSRGARALAKALGIKKIRTNHTKYKPRIDDVIVNWGNTLMPIFAPARILNTVSAVDRASNKLLAYNIMEDAGVPVPKFTTDPDQVIEWLEKDYTVVGRRLLRASEGRGIEMIYPEDLDMFVVDRKQCPLYTLYRKKMDEYRIHVFDGKVFDQQIKRRSTSDGRWEGDNRVRNTSGGWVFAREGVNAPPPILEAATKAVRSLGLDFGAADCGFSVGKNAATVYEVNTAPGLTGTTLKKYREEFSAYASPRGQ